MASKANIQKIAKTIKSAKNFSKSVPKNPKNENLEEKEDKKLKEMVKEIKEPAKENKRNVKTANASNHSIPRNINEYRHLISGFDGGFNITENDIDWVLKLRSKDVELSEKSKRVTDHLYSFYGKGLEGTQMKRTTTDLGSKGNVNSIDHLLRGRLGPTPGLGVVSFETSLRSTEKTSQELKEREKKWCNIPKKDKKDFPTFLPKLKEEIKMRQTFKDGDLTKMKLETAFDPDINFPKYQEKFRYKNLNNLTHLLKPGNTLPMVQWQLSLR